MAEELATAALGSHLARLRKLGGWSQAALAQAVGVSRQTLIALEQGEREPSLGLAVALADRLGVSLEALVAPARRRPPQRPDRWVPGPPPPHPQPVVWARVEGSLVVAPWSLVSAGTAVDGWWDPASGVVVPTADARDPETVVFVGGCDPFLPWLQARFRQALPGRHLEGIWLSSRAALDALVQGKLHVAGTHLYDSATGTYNRIVDRLPVAVERLPYLQWEEGLVRQPTQLPIQQWAVREPGSEAEALWRRRVPDAGQAAVMRFGRHQSLVEFVANHPSAAGVSLGALAALYGLEFVPWAREEFHWCCRRQDRQAWWFGPFAELVAPDALAPWFAAVPYAAPSG